MSDAVEVLIGNAVVAELNDPARSWQTPTALFTAVFAWLPVSKPEEMESLVVTVVPLTLDETKIGRNLEKMDYGIVVDFRKLLTLVSGEIVTAEVDALTKIVQDVHDFYRTAAGRGTYRLTTYTEGIVTGAARTDIYLEDPMYDHHVFESALALTVTVNR